MDGWVTVKTYGYRYEADIAEQYLRSFEISVFVKSDDARGLHPGLTFSSGVEVQVPEGDAEEARALLKELDSTKTHLEIVKSQKKDS